MATSSHAVPIPRLWNDPEQVLQEWPSNISPKRLRLFCDTMVHSFQNEGDFFVPAVFRCDSKVTVWGLEWLESQNKVVICPKLKYLEIGHPTTGLNVLEFQGLDNNTALLIVEESIPKSEDSIRYGLILDYWKMDLDMCDSITKKGMLCNLNNSHLWTPSEIKDEWDVIDEQRQEKNGPIQKSVQVSPAKPGSKPRAQKRKSIAGAPGDEEPAEGSSKKKRKVTTPALTIQRAVNMTDTDINKMNPEEQKAMNKLYQDTFLPLYKWLKKPLENAQGKPIRVHYKFLHEAPPGRVVYRGIQQDRLKKIKNRILVDADYTSENRYITVLPLKVGPHGPDKQVKYWDECPKQESLTSTTHYYIIGGQHTVHATRVLVESGDIPQKDRAWASTFNIIPIWRKYDPKDMVIAHLSRALNQNIVGEQREQNFTKQLLHCRLKWREVGSPMPSLYGRGHSKAYTDFHPIVSTIFTGVKGTDAVDLKIPLLFMEDDADVERWIKIEEQYLNYEIPDGMGEASKAKRKPFSKNDFKPLYGLRTEDINYLAGLVKNGEVCMKNVRAGAVYYGLSLIPLSAAGTREKQIRVMKNELMNHYLQYLLPSKSPKYIPYTAGEWDSFADDKRITRDDLELWVDKSLATELGKEWLKGRMQGLNKTSDPADCPEQVKSMWRTFMGVHAEEAVEAAAIQSFDMHYCVHEMDESTWDISSILANDEVKAWRGLGMTHVYFWFLFEVTRVGADAKALENHKLRRLFDALEYRDSASQVARARSPAVLITDALGFHSILCHLQKRYEQSKSRVWDWHVVNYIPDGSDGFPRPFVGSNPNVFLVFLYEHDEDHGASASFLRFFPGLQDLKAVYTSAEMDDMETCYRRRPRPWFKIISAINIFGSLTFKNIVLVNVNGGAEFTFLGMWAGWKVLEVVDSEEGKGRAATTARQIWDQFHHFKPASDDEEEEADSPNVDDEEGGQDAGNNEGDHTNSEERNEGEDYEERAGLQDEAVEIEPPYEQDKEDDDFQILGRNDVGVGPNSDVDSSATEDDLPPPIQLPRQGDRPRDRAVTTNLRTDKRHPVQTSSVTVSKKGRSTSRSTSRKSSASRERRSKRNLDFPENDFRTAATVNVTAAVQGSDDDLQEIFPKNFVRTTVPSREPASTQGTAVSLENTTDIPGADHVDNVVIEDPEAAVEDIGSTDTPVLDPHSLPTIVQEALGQVETTRSSGELQMDRNDLGELSRDPRAFLRDSEGLVRENEAPSASGALQMDSQASVPSTAEARVTESSGNLSVDLLVDASKFVGLTEGIKRAEDGCNPLNAVEFTEGTVPTPRESVAEECEVKTAKASGDLQMCGEMSSGPVVNMSENILQDTLSDLPPMSPEAESSKVNPFSVTKFPGFSEAEVLKHKEKFDVFLQCPKFKYNKKGGITNASKYTRNVWRANQYVYNSLFEVSVDHGPQAQQVEGIRDPLGEECKGASGSDEPKLTRAPEIDEVPCRKSTSTRASDP